MNVLNLILQLINIPKTYIEIKKEERVCCSYTYKISIKTCVIYNIIFIKTYKYELNVYKPKIDVHHFVIDIFYRKTIIIGFSGETLTFSCTERKNLNMFPCNNERLCFEDFKYALPRVRSTLSG